MTETATEYDDDRPGMMRVHIAQERERDVREKIPNLPDLRHAMRVRLLRDSGNRRDLVERLVEAGFTADDVLNGEMESRHTRGRA